MKTVLCLLCVTVYAVVAVPVENVGKSYPRFIEMPDGDGNMHQVDLEAEPDMELLSEITRNPANNKYQLYTSLPSKSDVNVIIIDWRRLAISTYPTAVAGVPAVGRGLGQFLNFLNRVTGAPFNTMHLVGFSLGAHLVGNAGRELGGRVARVTGLDPAGPLWNVNSNRLRSSDGVYVEAIHTDGGALGLGIGSAVANADFFPNGGNSQPGCVTSLCNHNRAWELFAATVTHNHLVGRQCSNTVQITANTCRGGNLHMGNDILNKRGSGLYRLDTGRRYPY